MDDQKAEKKSKGKTINVMDLPTVQCKCDNITWEEAKLLKKLTIDSDKEEKEQKHVIVDVMVCKRCGSILSDGIPIIKLRKEGENV